MMIYVDRARKCNLFWLKLGRMRWRFHVKDAKGGHVNSHAIGAESANRSRFSAVINRKSLSTFFLSRLSLSSPYPPVSRLHARNRYPL